MLAEPLIARYDSPRFDNSAVDGYAVRADDLASASPDRPTALPLVGTVAAGDMGFGEHEQGTATRILTGAPVPNGADAVVMQEDVEREGRSVAFSRSVRLGQHIRKQGEEYLAGAVLLPTGSALAPPQIALLAEQGISEARVYSLPRVAVVATGRELAPPGVELARGQIHASNHVGLAAAVEAIGFPVVFQAVVGDDLEATRKVVACALAQADVLITSGGVSVGDCDVVKPVLADLGVQTMVCGVSMKPGKPFFFGVRGRQRVFGLPGNPVATFVTFATLVRPALLRIAGHHPADRIYRAILDGHVGPVADRTEFLRGTTRLEKGRLVVCPCECQGASMTSGLARADGLIRRLPGSAAAAAGDEVDLILLDWHR